MHKYNGFAVYPALARMPAWGSAALVAIALMAGCTHTPTSKRPVDTPAASSAAPDTSRPLSTNDTQDSLSARMREHAPLRYVVKPGDTLWDIAGYYLREPWYWPQLWQANPDIANPHRIYPGEVLVLSRGAQGRPRLRRARSEHLSPTIREQPLAAAIATIPRQAIQAFITGPRVVSEQQLAHAPYILSFQGGHLVGGAGTGVYVRGAPSTGPARYSIVRGAGDYRDPATGDKLGAKALPIGQLRIDTFDRIATGTITDSNREALTGDRLLALRADSLVRDFYPHAPDHSIEARIISVYGGLAAVGQYQVVALNRGRADGIERGTVLTAYAAGQVVDDPVAGGEVTLPPRRAGSLLIFKVNKQVSFALIMQSRLAIHIGDSARSPS